MDRHRFLLRYGVFAVLLVLSLGTLLLMNVISVRTKAAVSLCLAADGSCQAYVDRTAGFLPAVGDTVRVEQTTAGTMAGVVSAVRLEPAHVVLTLRPLAPVDASAGTFATGYVFTGSLRLRQLVARQMGF